MKQHTEFEMLLKTTLFSLMSVFCLWSLFFIKLSSAESKLKDAEGELHQLGLNYTAYADGMQIAVRETYPPLNIISDNAFFIVQVAKMAMDMLGSNAERVLCLFLSSGGTVREKITRNSESVYEMGSYYEDRITLSDSVFELARHANDPVFPGKVFMHELWHAGHGQLNPKALNG